MNICTILIIIGTRPEAIKLCPIILELYKHKQFNPIIVCTGQHDSMVKTVLSLFNIEPTIWLDMNSIQFQPQSKPNSLSTLTSQILINMMGIISTYKPEFIMVQGDTTSAYTSALSGFYTNVPIIHIEAGLRSYNMSQPYPEEFNRVSISLIASFHFTTTSIAMNNLSKENICKEKCFNVGNTIVDSYQYIIQNYYNGYVDKEKLILITCHRRENWDEPLIKLCKSIKFLCESYPNYDFVFCSHPNPLVSNIVTNELDSTTCTILNSVPYDEFLGYVLKAKIIITDSGGIQEEACISGTPTLVYRHVTERPEGLDTCLKLIGNDTSMLQDEIKKLIDDEDYYNKMNIPLKCYGNGDASQKIVSILSQYMNKIC